MPQMEWPRAVYQEVLHGVQESISARSDRRPEHVDLDMHLRTDLDMDTVGIVDLIHDCERRFCVKITSKVGGAIRTVDDLVECILNLQTAALST